MLIQPAPLQLPSPAFRCLLRGVDQAVRGAASSAAVIEGVAACLRDVILDRDLLTDAQKQPDPLRYRQHVLHVAEDGLYSIVSLVWIPTQETPVHDHVSWCVVGVHQGIERETSYRCDGGDGVTEIGQGLNPAGTVVGLLPPADIHKVANGGEDLAISLHIYGADLSRCASSILRKYPAN
jgi:predicted metal-dependent enzyme (double-stranded beta helix superfamily)